MTATLATILSCKAGSARPCNREATVVLHAVRRVPASPLCGARDVQVAVRACEVHGARIARGQTVAGIGKIVRKETL